MAIRTDKLQATYAGNIESVVFAKDVQNGEIGVLGAQAGRELVNAAAPTDVTKEEIVIIASPEVVYKKEETLLDFVNKANKAARAYHLTEGDIITVTDDVIEGTSVVNQYLVPANGKTKLVPAADLTGGTRFAAKVIEKGKLYGQPATAFRVVTV
ncbi:hypothetical protein D3C73_185710 [compost metagenome]